MQIDAYAILLWVHVLLLVYWLGADLGVLIAGLWFKDSALSLGERTLLLKLIAAIDLAPRIAFALALPVGFTLATARWNLPVPSVTPAVLWLITAPWIGGILIAYKRQGQPIAAVINHIQFYWLIACGCALIAFGVWLLGSGAEAPWLACKIILYGAIFFLAIGIDLAFRPIIPAFTKLAIGGSTPEIERSISENMDRTIIVVVSLYGVLLVISFLGVIKPDL